MNISDRIQDYLVKSKTKKIDSSRDRKYYVSDMGKCQRMRWLKRKGIAQEFAPHVQWIFQIGDLYHDYVYKVLESQGVLLKSEESIETDHFSGRYDGIIKTDEGQAVLDIKSTSGYKIDKLAKGEEDEQYISQVLTYQMLLKDEGSKTAKSVVLYVNKEPSDKRPDIFIQKDYRLTKWREEQLRAEMQTMVDFWEGDKIPRCTCPAWMKAYNSFQPLCEMADDKARKILKNLDNGKAYVTSKEALYLVDGDKRKEVSRVK